VVAPDPLVEEVALATVSKPAGRSGSPFQTGGAGCSPSLVAAGAHPPLSGTALLEVLLVVAVPTLFQEYFLWIISDVGIKPVDIGFSVGGS
jgi:hypothetical protein